MKLYEKQEIMTVTNKQIGVVCDMCDSDIKGVYYEITTHHNDWGNDSCDSYNHFEFCSLECMRKHMDDYFKNAIGSEQYDIERCKR